MAKTENIMSSDIFMATKFVEKLKAKYVDVSEDTLLLGVYGYLSAIFGNLIQNTATMISEYSTEAIPSRAKFEKNIIAHALSLGLKSINANPAQLNVLIAFPEEYLIKNMTDNLLVLDKEYVFNVGDRQLYPYVLDYNIEIKRNILPNGKTVYTAMYDIDNKNPLSKLTNPYLPALGIITAEGQDMVALQTSLRQMTHSTIHHKLIVDNPLETKTREFTFENQLAYFYVEVTEETDEGTEVHYLEPIYEGLYDYQSDKEYINYMYLDEKTIRLKFNRRSYQPRKNAEIDIHVYTTLGSECNIYLDDSFQIYRELVSKTYNYSGLYAMIRSNSSSLYGEDRATIESLKELIPREMLSRGSYSTYKDLSSFFNLAQTEDCKISLFERVYNQMENVYYAYLLMKYQSSVIPTNTIDVEFDRESFSIASKSNYIIFPGTNIYLDYNADTAYTLPGTLTSSNIENLENQGFLYTCPYLMVVNKNPFYVSFYNVFLKYDRVLYFDYINDNSDLQFIAERFRVYRNAFDNPDNEFHMEVQCMQNINSDYDLLVYNEDSELIDKNIAAYAVFYTKDSDGNSYASRYVEGDLISFNTSSSVYTFDFKMTTQNMMAGKTVHMLFNTGLHMMTTGEETPSYLEQNLEMKIFIFIKGDQEYGRDYNNHSTDIMFPNLDGWSLTNVYTAGEAGIDIFYDYSDLMTSFINLDRRDSGFKYTISKLPVVRKSWWNEEYKATYFFQMLDYRRRYIQESLGLIDNPFGINFKLYNTYGPSKNYNINKKQLIDRPNLSLELEVMFVTREDQYILEDMKETIKTYIEDFNRDENIHLPNLITYLTNLYSDSVEYIKFVKLNNYDTLWQSIYKNPDLIEKPFKESQNTPEFININTLSNGDLDITFDVVE